MWPGSYDPKPVCIGFTECWFYSVGNVLEFFALVLPWVCALVVVVIACITVSRLCHAVLWWLDR
jgi:hypothetical protein